TRHLVARLVDCHRTAARRIEEVTIRLAIAGVGNCASSLVQGLEYYRDADPAEDVPGLMNVMLGGYHVRDVEVVTAFDVDAAQVLRDSQADVLVSYLPVGSDDAQKHYAQACLDAGVAFVNAIPVFIASNPEWAAKFANAGIPIVGDDIKSQVGSTIVHRVLTRLAEDRGMAVDRTYQLNFGGNMDFKNMLERERLLSKKISKTQSVTSQLEH